MQTRAHTHTHTLTLSLDNLIQQCSNTRALSLSSTRNITRSPTHTRMLPRWPSLSRGAIFPPFPATPNMKRRRRSVSQLIFSVQSVCCRLGNTSNKKVACFFQQKLLSRSLVRSFAFAAFLQKREKLAKQN